MMASGQRGNATAPVDMIGSDLSSHDVNVIVDV